MQYDPCGLSIVRCKWYRPRSVGRWNAAARYYNVIRSASTGHRWTIEILLPEPIITVVSHHTEQFNERSVNALRISRIRTQVQPNSNPTAQLANYHTTLGSFNVAQVQVSAVTDVSNSVVGQWLSVFEEINVYEHNGGYERGRCNYYQGRKWSVLSEPPPEAVLWICTVTGRLCTDRRLLHRIFILCLFVCLLAFLIFLSPPCWVSQPTQ
jgi:hypothetical protein